MSETDSLLGRTRLDDSLPLAHDQGSKKKWYWPPNRKQKALLVVFSIWVVGMSFAIWKGLSGPKPDKNGLIWKPCLQNSTFLCTSFPVPTDYSCPSHGTTHLAMTLLPATSPRLGSLTTNYGGPGASGYSMSFLYAPMIHALAGGRYDVISWDPRGIGRTTPALRCHADGLAAAQFRANTLLESTFEVPPDPVGKGREVLVEQQREVLALWEVQAGLCGNTTGAEVLKYFGTTTLVRDIERIVEVLDGKEGKIHFHGGSYGTVVADYLVNMLPHKVGRVVAHGVATPPLWATEDYLNYKLLRALLLNAEPAYEGFFAQCHSAGPTHCALARKGDKGGTDVMGRVDEWVEGLYERPLAVVGGVRAGVLKSGMVKKAIFETLQFPDNFAAFATDLNLAMTGFPLALTSSLLRPISAPPTAPDGFTSLNQGDLQRLGVSCADAPGDYGEGREPVAVGEMVDALGEIWGNVSRHFGATVNLMEQHGGCQFWPRSDRPVERFSGPWNSTLANTILVVSNKDDPITPAPAGKEMADRFGSRARHIIQPGIGHSYLVPPSECYSKIAKRYFEDGTVPDDLTYVCQGEAPNAFLEAEGKGKGKTLQSLMFQL